MIVSKTNNTRINEAVDLANELLKNEEFLSNIQFDKDFDMSNVGGVIIAILIKEFADFEYGTLEVHSYKSFNPWSRAYGYFSPANPNHIYLNTRKLNRSIGSIVSSIIHELIHFLDHKNPDYTFGHGDNSPIGKQNTAPYWIDNLAESFVDYRLMDDQNMENSNIVYYVPWYKRLFRWIF